MPIALALIAGLGLATCRVAVRSSMIAAQPTVASSDDYLLDDTDCEVTDGTPYASGTLASAVEGSHEFLVEVRVFEAGTFVAVRGHRATLARGERFDFSGIVFGPPVLDRGLDPRLVTCDFVVFRV